MYDVTSSITGFQERVVLIERVAFEGEMVLTLACTAPLLLCTVRCGTEELQATVQTPSSKVMTSIFRVRCCFYPFPRLLLGGNRSGVSSTGLQPCSARCQELLEECNGRSCS